MIRNQTQTLSALLVSALTVLAAPSAKAASLQPVTADWKGGTNFPSDVTMSIYVPDTVATNPPILTLVHYCGGFAQNVFGQAQGGGIVSAADQYGFIMVVPSSGRCWDVVSSATRTRDGGGDSHAIKQMVTYAISTYHANADRVYSTGDSSGGMMTQLLLALYPDIFKGGSSFAGIPAGCGTTTSAPGGYDNVCAGGNVTHSPQEWGDMVRNMYPGYTGHRPRLQLFHGEQDTYVDYKNLGDSISQYINLLSLSTDPTSEETGLTLGTHQATRQKWQNSCGFLVLDAFTSIAGDHGPSDALFVAQYVIPFLGLDKTGAVDPEIEQCGAGGTGGVGGSGGAGGAGGATSTVDSGGMSDGGSGGLDTGVSGSGGSGGSTDTSITAGAGGVGLAGAGGTDLTDTSGTYVSAGVGGQGGNTATGVSTQTGSSSSGCKCSLALGGQERRSSSDAAMVLLAALGLLLRRPKRRTR
jgi:acetylxylan esterase